ncbi:MAG: hypothetical protein M3O70_02700 [Actinomycetota bacterium]|nr:hypothetical protein [Actinomycetota bacterium]
MSDGWEIRWTLQSGQYGQLMAVYLNNADGSSALHNAVPVNTQAAGPGSMYVAQGGSYTLQVNAMGSWTMKVEDLP